MTANQVLNHPWIAQRERAAYGVQRSKSFVKLKRFNGKRKMKVVLLAATIVSLSTTEFFTTITNFQLQRASCTERYFFFTLGCSNEEVVFTM